jgi:gamma-glutamyltranspeptidase
MRPVKINVSFVQSKELPFESQTFSPSIIFIFENILTSFQLLLISRAPPYRKMEKYQIAISKEVHF